MALFHSFLFGNLHQSVANLVMYTSRNQEIVRGKPMKIHNPRTPMQTEARIRFKAANQLVARLHQAAAVGFPSAYVTASRNAFVRANRQAFDLDGTLVAHLDSRRLVFSAGQQLSPAMKATFSDGQFRVASAVQNISAFSTREDLLYLVLWEDERLAAHLIIFGKRGNVLKQIYPIPVRWSPSHTFVYCFAISANGKRASNSLLLWDGSREV
ncbi:MAG: hypothetical protein RSA98_08945 [Odoribacter sp.]